MDLPARDGDGYLQDMGEWTEEIARAMAEADNYELSDQKWEMIMKAREYYDEYQQVPPPMKGVSALGRFPMVGLGSPAGMVAQA